LEAMAFQTRDVLVCMERDAGVALKELHVDGGAAVNNFLMQFQADILGCEVHRPQQIESTVLGAARLAAKALQFGDTDNKQEESSIFAPKITTETRINLCQGWKKTVEKAR